LQAYARTLIPDTERPTEARGWHDAESTTWCQVPDNRLPKPLPLPRTAIAFHANAWIPMLRHSNRLGN